MCLELVCGLCSEVMFMDFFFVILVGVCCWMNIGFFFYFIVTVFSSLILFKLISSEVSVRMLVVVFIESKNFNIVNCNVLV